MREPSPNVARAQTSREPSLDDARTQPNTSESAPCRFTVSSSALPIMLRSSPCISIGENERHSTAGLNWLHHCYLLASLLDSNMVRNIRLNKKKRIPNFKVWGVVQIFKKKIQIFNFCWGRGDCGSLVQMCNLAAGVLFWDCQGSNPFARVRFWDWQDPIYFLKEFNFEINKGPFCFAFY